jgi:protein transport protein DSL1/ZW10
VFAEHSSTTTVRGQLLIAAAPSILDLLRALYPIAHSTSLARDPNLAMLWSNDCKFLSDEVAKLRHRHGLASTEERWPETADKLKALGELCYDDVVVCLCSV